MENGESVRTRTYVLKTASGGETPVLLDRKDFCGRRERNACMSENYVECLVKAKGSLGFALLKWFLYFVTILCAISIFMFGTGIIGMLLAMAAGYGGYYVGTLADIEYEYLYLDKELVVDKVMAKTRRKRVATYSMDRVEIFAPIKSYRLDNYKNRQTKDRDYSIGYEDKPDRRYVFYYEGGERILLSPSEEMLKVMKNANPRKVFTD